MIAYRLQLSPSRGAAQPWLYVTLLHPLHFYLALSLFFASLPLRLLIMTAAVNSENSSSLFCVVLFCAFLIPNQFLLTRAILVFLSRNLHEFSACCKVKSINNSFFAAARLNKRAKNAGKAGCQQTLQVEMCKRFTFVQQPPDASTSRQV